MEGYYKEEVECANQYLDFLNVPNIGEKGKLSLVGRIKRLKVMYLKELSEIESFYLRQKD